MASAEPWHIKGELMLSCNCTVFCPCVVSLGKHPPTEGYCQTWGGVRIDDGKYGDVDLSGINLGLIIEIPGLMGRGKWTAGLYVDERADAYQTRALTRIMTGKVGGPPRVMSILVANFLGVHHEPISYEVEGDVRKFKIPKIIDGEIAPIPGQTQGQHTAIENSQYWISPRIVVAQAIRSKFRAFGRNWDFHGRSAEICDLDWVGP